MVHGKKKRRDAAQPGAKKKAVVERKSTVAMETGTETKAVEVGSKPRDGDRPLVNSTVN